jgi:5-methyltetrahydropteroyltriglutamate--homocysteine methyltransferase
MAQVDESGTTQVFEAIMGPTFAVTQKVERGPMRHALNWSTAQRCTTKPVKAFFGMGPVELSATLTDEHYKDRKALLRDLAEIFHAEMVEAVQAGAQIVELDDLIFLAPQDEWEFDVEILNRVFDGVDAYRIWHCCHGGTPAPIGMAPYEAMFPYVKDLQVESFDWSFAQTGFQDRELALFATPGFDKDLGLGVISNKNYVIETPQDVAEAIKRPRSTSTRPASTSRPTAVCSRTPAPPPRRSCPRWCGARRWPARSWRRCRPEPADRRGGASAVSVSWGRMG